MNRLYGSCSLFALFATAGMAAPAPASATTAIKAPFADHVAPTPITEIVQEVVIPYETFTLANGLRVIVQTDHRASVVSITVDYLVGSTSEPPRRTGFAHLFEHLMFNGSENAPGDYSLPFQELGAELNGITLHDRTTYYENVPTAGLERALFLESDRMGYLLGAVGQKTLDEQRGVVQNEKRQADDRPLARVRDHVRKAVYPAGHPYAHNVFGSMTDLNNADLPDVREWFRTHYAPGNAILTLAGDIDGATARRLVERYFGPIPAGPVSTPPPAPVPMPASRREETLTDRVANPRLFRAWATPGAEDPQAPALEVAVGVMARSSTGYLKQQLLEQEALFSDLAVSFELADRGGLIVIEGSIKDGVDPALASRRLDAAVKEMLVRGAAREDIDRYVANLVSQKIRLLDSSAGKASLLTAAMRTTGDPENYRAQLDRLAGQTPATVEVAATTWFGRPPYALTVLPGEAAPFEPVGAPPQPSSADVEPQLTRVNRGALPPLGVFNAPTFPSPEQARLSNGIEILYMKGSGAPLTQVDVEFKVDTGTLSHHSPLPVLIDLIADGSARRSAEEMSVERDALGAMLDIQSEGDHAVVSLSALSPNLQPSLELMAETLLTPSFSEASLDRQKQSRIDALKQRQMEGADIQDVISSLMEGGSQEGPPASEDWSHERIVACYRAWIRPEKATIYVVSDRTLPEIQAMLERVFGQWRVDGPAGKTARHGRMLPATPGIYLVNQAGSDQALIFGGQAITFANDDQRLAATLANSALGDSFSSRLNTELRETRGWSYGVQGRFDARRDEARYVVSAPVQQDRAGAALQAVQNNIAAFVSDAPLTDAEFSLAVDNQVRALSVSYTDGKSYIDAIQENRRLGRPDAYQATLAARYRRLGLQEARAAISATLHPDRFVWVVVGDVTTIKPQLDELNLPFTVVSRTPEREP